MCVGRWFDVRNVELMKWYFADESLDDDELLADGL